MLTFISCTGHVETPQFLVVRTSIQKVTRDRCLSLTKAVSKLSRDRCFQSRSFSMLASLSTGASQTRMPMASACSAWPATSSVFQDPLAYRMTSAWSTEPTRVTPGRRPTDLAWWGFLTVHWLVECSAENTCLAASMPMFTRKGLWLNAGIEKSRTFSRGMVLRPRCWPPRSTCLSQKNGVLPQQSWPWLGRGTGPAILRSLWDRLPSRRSKSVSTLSSLRNCPRSSWMLWMLSSKNFETLPCTTARKKFSRRLHG
mmetsp:Transcript_63197/g.112332  ORF Transcript_63197/g.112332 Transcript_63197/m.112332 type:complete len:256 (+) Transcript_63197:469-1236(+)